jgi:dienelactone hydrolase
MPKLTDFEIKTAPLIWRQYDDAERKLAFRARSYAEAAAWQTELRDVLIRLLGGKPADTADLDPHLIEAAQEQGYRRELIVIRTQPGDYMPCYVLIPHNAAPPYRTVIAVHGHEIGGADGIIGLRNREGDEHPNDYARQLALHGYLVFVPMMRAFAQRLESSAGSFDQLSDEHQRMTNSCRELSLNAILLGQTLLGLRVWDVMRLIDYIHTRPEPMKETLGCVGLSGGGTVTLFTTALDIRITCAIVSGYLNSFRASIMSIEHCPCNYIPGILQYAEMPDIAGLIAPRPLLVEAGERDPIFPVAATRQALAELRPVYACFGAEDKLDADIFDGEHRWSGVKAFDWLDRWL